MEYKEGDKVQIKSLDWYNENKDEDGEIEFEEFRFVSPMSEFCGKILTIDVDFEDGTYLMKEDIDGFVFTNEMIERLVEEENEDKLKLDSTKTVREYWSEYTRICIEIYEDEPNECVFTHLYTLEGHRQKGYGRRALTEAEEIANELGCNVAYLKVETDSWMHQWYLRMGYKWYKNINNEYTWLTKNLKQCK